MIFLKEGLSLQSKMIKALLFINHILVILFIESFITHSLPFKIQTIVPLFLATCFLIDVTYVASCNLKETPIRFLFCGLLVADSWYLLLTARMTEKINLYFQLLSPIILYLSIQFCFLLIFQGYHYKFKKTADRLLMILCIMTLIGAIFSKRMYACTYGVQLISSFLCFLWIIFYHRKRVAFMIRSERKILLLSLIVTFLTFIMYCFFTQSIEHPIENFGIYLILMIFSINMHGILFKEKVGIPLSTLFSLKQQISFLVISISIFAFISLKLESSLFIFLILTHLLFALIFLFNIILEENLKHQDYALIQNSTYLFALKQLKQEEKLRAEFSNFLHDDVLQDLLSIKNILYKSHLPEIQELIYETLEHLNQRIRYQMQDYHIVTMKNLTIKENLVHLIQSISETFPDRQIQVTFSCSDTFFVANPYDLFVYRLIKELLTNVYKHSNGNQAWITVVLKQNRLHLTVCDNGTADSLLNQQNHTVLPKGLSSIKEQITQLGGTIQIVAHKPQGVKIEVQLIMKGTVSYEYFTH